MATPTPASALDRNALQTQMTAELRKARGWILAVGIINFVIDSMIIQVLDVYHLPAEWKMRFLVIDVAILAFFVTLFGVAKRFPKPACIIALIGFWGLQFGVAAYTGDVSAVFTQGIVLKVLFTLALVRGIRSASTAEHLKSELERVFE